MKQRKARRWYGRVRLDFKLLYVSLRTGDKAITYRGCIKPYSTEAAKRVKQMLRTHAKLDLNGTYGKLGSIRAPLWSYSYDLAEKITSTARMVLNELAELEKNDAATDSQV